MQRSRPGAATLVVLALVGATLVACASYRPPVDCTNWRYDADDEPAAGVLPAEYDRDGYELTSRRDPKLASSIQNHCGQKGAAVDLAWGVTTGRDDVLIAVLDSGIEWRDAGAMADLRTQAYVNRGEAAPPCAASGGDCNGDGRFDIRDFGAIADRNGNGTADPEDLILDPAYSDGVDDDGNGYVDDISGWDLLRGDNNPLDTVEYGHGTGEAKDSTAAADGSGSVGTCPRCRFLPVRVGDSFIADGARFAAGVLFGLDSGADVIQEALGAISNPPQAQQAIDAAYERGVVVVASAADEASEHPNLPANLEHTMVVNSITERDDPVGNTVDGYLALNGCTNFGGAVWVSVPSSSCSSGATGLGSGMVGLVESAARDAGLAPYPGQGGPGGNVLSANEVMQLVRANADDVDFSTPTATDPANNFGLPPTGFVIQNSRYQTRRGWDLTSGFGRINAYEIVRNVKASRIPPEADIVGPGLFSVHPTTGTLDVTGTVAAVRASKFDWTLEWAPGAQAPAHPGTDSWRPIAGETGRTTPRTGLLGSVSLATIAAALPDGATGASVGGDGKPDGDRFAVRLRLTVTSQGGTTRGLTGVDQRQVFVHADPDLVPGHPRPVPGASTSSPVFADLDGAAPDELVVATSDGVVHAYRPDGTEPAGWPVRTAPAPWWPTWSATATADGIAVPGNAVLVGAPAVADLDDDGDADVVVADAAGNVWAWDRTGARLPGFAEVTVAGHAVSQARVNPAFAPDDPASQDENNRTQPAVLGSPALGQLDADPQLEVVVAALDRHVYAFGHDGVTQPGFPVLLADPAKVGSVASGSHAITWAAGSNITQSGGMIATPALADLNGDGRDEIVVGAQESYVETPDAAGPISIDSVLGLIGLGGNARVYALAANGRNAANPDRNAAHPDDQAYLPGWPVPVAQIQLNALPLLGDGVATQVAIGDVNPSPGPEVIAQSAGGPTYVLKADGTSAFGSTGGKRKVSAWAGGLFNEENGRFGGSRNSSDIIVNAAAFSGPAIGRIDGDATPDYATNTAGLTRLMDIALSDFQPPADDTLTAYRGSDGNALPGFPQNTTDLAFFVTPAIADLDGDGANEVVAGNGVYTLSAHEADGSRPAGYAKLTGGWVVGTPSLGQFDGDATAELAVMRRDGLLLVWNTLAPVASLTEWTRFGGNSRNTGEYRAD